MPVPQASASTAGRGIAGLTKRSSCVDAAKAAAQNSAGSSRCSCSARSDACSTARAASSASAGNIGRMYEGSFDPDALKNTNTKTDQTSSRLVAKSERRARSSQGSALVHGSIPTSRIGTKYHQAPVRRCTVVR